MLALMVAMVHNKAMLVRNRGTYCVNINTAENKIRAPGGRVAAGMKRLLASSFYMVAQFILKS